MLELSELMEADVEESEDESDESDDDELDEDPVEVLAPPLDFSFRA